MIEKEMIVQLSSEIQERISLQMEDGKMERMNAFATDGKIDSTGLMAFVLAEAKLYTTLFTTDFLVSIAEYEEMDQKLADGTLEMPEMDHVESEHPLEMEADWELVKCGEEPPENLQVAGESALEQLEARERALHGEQ